MGVICLYNDKEGIIDKHKISKKHKFLLCQTEGFRLNT